MVDRQIGIQMMRFANHPYLTQGVVSLELLTVFIVGPMACWVCYDIAKKNSRVNIVMIMIATAEIYGGMYPTLPFPFFWCRCS